MAKKKKHPEHENLERWLISYADFITLLFATFVVLYALSQVDISDFQKLENSIKKAFEAPSLMQGSEGVMDSSAGSIFDSSQADSVITPLMMEYMSPKYEEQSYEEIAKNIDEMSKTGEIEGVETEMTERGLVIRFDDDYLFKSGSAVLSPAAQTKLDKVGAVIGKKFILHYMRIEGHTDNKPIVSVVYPSNWELSSARASSIIRYFIKRFSFTPSLFTAVGFADTRPIADNISEKGRSRNRRVEILILKNKFKNQENPQNDIMKMSKEQQEDMHLRRLETVSKIKIMSQVDERPAAEIKKEEASAAVINQIYKKEEQRLSIETKALDDTTRTKITGQGDWLRPPANVKNSSNGKNMKSELDKEHKSEIR